MKKIYTLVLASLMAGFTFAQTTETIDFTAQGWSNQDTLTDKAVSGTDKFGSNDDNGTCHRRLPTTSGKLCHQSIRCLGSGI